MTAMEEWYSLSFKDLRFRMFYTIIYKLFSEKHGMLVLAIVKCMNGISIPLL